MFRKPLLALALLGVIASSGGCAQKPPAQPDTAADQAKLQADALIWFDYYAKVDADGMANLYAEDALLMPPGAPAVTGRPGIKTFLGEDAAKSKAAGISLKNASVTGSGINGDTGWISGTYTVVDASGATIDSGSYLSVHRRANGAWPYIRDIWNSDRPPAPPSPAPDPSGKM
jgi:ketosteroid isomerase-like protein